MATAKINNQFDYITLRVKFDDKTTFNLTKSRYGVKVSGSRATQSALDFFDRWFHERKNCTLGDSFTHLCAVAAKSNDMQTFIAAV